MSTISIVVICVLGVLLGLAVAALYMVMSAVGDIFETLFGFWGHR